MPTSGLGASAFNPSTGGQRQGNLCEFGVSLVCKMSSRIARTDCFKTNKQQTKAKKEQWTPTLGMVARPCNGEVEAGESLQV